jgi:hypothetical protein
MSNIFRLIILACVPILSVLLRSMEAGLGHELTFLGFISTTTVYNPLSTFQVSGGVGTYNASYPGYWDPNNIATTAAQISYFVFNSGSGQILLSQESGQASHLLVGGIGFMQPTGEIFGNDFPAADSVFAHQQLGAQIDVWDQIPEVVLNRNDCKIWGIPLYALQLCIVSAPGNTAAFIAGTIHIK